MISVISLLYIPAASNAQEAAYKWNIGVNLGLGGYIGDYNMGGVFSNPGFAGDITAGYIYDTRWEFSSDIGYKSVKGSIGKPEEYPMDIPTSFTGAVYELNFKTEFNFFPYGIGETYKALKLWTPYVGAGIGIVGAKPTGGSFSVAPEIPLTFGFKFKLSPRLNAKLEFEATKTFTHGIDPMESPYGIERSWFKGTDWLMALQIGISYEFGERCATCNYVD